MQCPVLEPPTVAPFCLLFHGTLERKLGQPKAKCQRAQVDGELKHRKTTYRLWGKEPGQQREGDQTDQGGTHGSGGELEDGSRIQL